MSPLPVPATCRSVLFIFPVFSFHLPKSMCQFCGWCHLVFFGIGLLAFHALVYKSVFTLTGVALLLSNFMWW